MRDSARVGKVGLDNDRGGKVGLEEGIFVELEGFVCMSRCAREAERENCASLKNERQCYG